MLKMTIGFNGNLQTEGIFFGVIPPNLTPWNSLTVWDSVFSSNSKQSLKNLLKEINTKFAAEKRFLGLGVGCGNTVLIHVFVGEKKAIQNRDKEKQLNCTQQYHLKVEIFRKRLIKPKKNISQWKGKENNRLLVTCCLKVCTAKKPQQINVKLVMYFTKKSFVWKFAFVYAHNEKVPKNRLTWNSSKICCNALQAALCFSHFAWWNIQLWLSQCGQVQSKP